MFMEPRIRFQRIISASLCCLLGRYEYDPRCSTHVDIVHTRLSLHCMKFSSANDLNVCTSLPQVGDPAFDFTCSLVVHHVIRTPRAHFLTKMTHIERQRVLLVFKGTGEKFFGSHFEFFTIL
jgi:hypothetical protein